MKWFAFLSLLTLTLAGCASEEPTGTDSPADSDAGTQGGNETAQDNATDLPPVISFTASNLTGNGTTFIEFGLNVTDENLANIDWTFFATNESLPISGFDVPANFSVSYEPGLHNATVWVSDGTHNVSATLTVDIGPGAPEAPPLAEVASYETSGIIGLYPLRDNTNVMFSCPGFTLGTGGHGCAWTAIDNHDGLLLHLSADTGNLRGTFASECGATATGLLFFAGDSNEGQFSVPAGTGCVVLWSSAVADLGEERTFNLSILA